MEGFEIVPLAAHHDRASFSCGEDSLDRYLRDRVRWDESANVTACHVLTAASSPDQIAGYYTLSAAGVELGDLPERLAKRLPRYATIPVVLLGRLAIDRRYQGQGLGRVLVFDSFHKTLEIRERGGAWGVIVDALDEGATAFYERNGFDRFPNQPRRLFIPLRDARAALVAAGVPIDS